MKIASFHSQILNVPEDEPLAGAVEKEGSTRPIVTLTLATDDGIEGIGVSFYGGALTRTLKSAIDQLSELCVGEDPHRVEALGQPLWRLLGGLRNRVPAYASGALRRGLPLDTVVKAAATLKDKGW